MRKKPTPNVVAISFACRTGQGRLIMNMHSGKCPKCEQMIGWVRFQGVDARPAIVGGKTWNAISFQCPHCYSVLGVQIDPIALKTETINEFDELLKKRR
jgi:hypothetical protein